MKKFITKLVNKQRKGFTLPEILICCAIIIALSTGTFFAISNAQQTRKMAQMQQDMENICNAALAYEALSMNSTAPATLDALVTGLTASQSIDGVAHKDLLKSTRANVGTDGTISSTSINDPWGGTYTYSQSARTVTCTPKDASGASAGTVTRAF